MSAGEPMLIGGARTHRSYGDAFGSVLHLPDGRLVERFGDRVRITVDERSTCHCEHPCAVDSVCGLCGGSLWWCCARADSEPHRRWCHTLGGWL